MEKLPIEFKEKWIAALRSGEYKQTEKYLYDGYGYCCLGVACKITGTEDWAMKKWGLPRDVEIEEDVKLNIPDFMLDYNSDVVDTLTYMNDGVPSTKYNPTGRKHSFSEIADWIETHL